MSASVFYVRDRARRCQSPRRARHRRPTCPLRCRSKRRDSAAASSGLGGRDVPGGYAPPRKGGHTLVSIRS